MELQKRYTRDELARFEVAKAAAAAQGAEPPRAAASHLRVLHTGVSEGQNFSTRFVEGGLVEGWLSFVELVDGKHMRIKCEHQSGQEPTGLTHPDGTPKMRPVYSNEDLIYRVVREPGYYCVSTGDRIPISGMAWGSSRRGELAPKEAKAWLAARGLAPTDYEVTNAYECILDSDQHERFKKG